MQPQSVSGTAAVTWRLNSALGKMIRVSVCLSTTVRRLFTFSFFFFFFLAWTNTAVLFAVSGRITTGPACCKVSLEQIIFPALAGVHSAVTQALLTLCMNFTVSGQFCPNSAVGLLVKINFFVCFSLLFTVPPSISIYIHTNSHCSHWEHRSTWAKQQHNLKLWRGFVKSEEISPDGDGGRVILVPAWKIQAFRLKPLLWKCNRASEWQGLLPGNVGLSWSAAEFSWWRMQQSESLTLKSNQRQNVLVVSHETLLVVGLFDNIYSRPKYKRQSNWMVSTRHP